MSSLSSRTIGEGGLLSAGFLWSPSVKHGLTSSTPFGKMRGCFSAGSSVQVFFEVCSPPFGDDSGEIRYPRVPVDHQRLSIV